MKPMGLNQKVETKEATTISMVSCPECGAEINAPNEVMLKEILSCPDCGLELEVSKIEGQNLELKKILIEKEDWGE
jgi:alpha-aminoadipate carrier protein LysW